MVSFRHKTHFWRAVQQPACPHLPAADLGDPCSGLPSGGRGPPEGGHDPSVKLLQILQSGKVELVRYQGLSWVSAFSIAFKMTLLE